MHEASTERLPTSRLGRLGATTARHPWRFVVGWLLVTVAAFAVAVGGVTGQSLFQRLQSGAPSVPREAQQGADLLAAHQSQGTSLLLQVKGASFTDTTAVAAASKATAELASIPGISAVKSPLLLPQGVANPAAAPLLAGGTASSGGFVTSAELERGLTSEQTNAANAAVRVAYDRIVAAFPGATGQVGGGGPLLTAITSQIEVDLRNGEGIALPLSFIVMFFVFGGFVAAGMPVVGAVVSIGGGLATLFGFSYLLDLDASVVNVVTLLGLGLSIDYGLLTVSRFREELRTISDRHGPRRRRRFNPDDTVLATARTMATAGRTVLFSGLTVAIALAGLMIFEAQITRAIGAAGVAIVLVAVLVDLTLLPALCALGARRLLSKGTERAPDTGVFSQLARFVQRRPIPVIVASLIVLLALAVPAVGIKLTSSGPELLPVSSPERVFFTDLAADYPALSAPDVTVAAEAPLATVQSWVSSSVTTLPDVESAQVREVTGSLSAVSIQVRGPALGTEADGVVDALRSNRPAFTTYVTGPAAQQLDFIQAMVQRAPYAAGLVALGTFVLLFLMTGSVVIPIKALILNVVSLGAALGVLVWVFQDGNLEGLLRFSSVGAIESLIPFLVLAFGFGLSMDYEMFLIARITELHRSDVPNDQAVSLGLQRSGRIITSAALLVIIVFAGFAAGQLLIIKEVGVALVVAVALDATVVRMLLVPATMTLLGTWNWWAPAPMRRWHDRHGITE
ncbi:MMPL family transporter [Lapillicoccus sp.]|uniref:MMPL family transporter n=1 Tax=Lapillicoccus sp. TaxID=1909287 RepID=UPI0032634773